MNPIPSWTTPVEQEALAELASQVPPHGQILEIGCLYGGSTSILCKNAPRCVVTSIDEFSWTPEGYPTATKELAEANLKEQDLYNFEIIPMSSEKAAKTWKQEVDLCFIDGGHSYEYVRADLENFHSFSRVLALHDFGNPFWPSIGQAVQDFLSKHPEWYQAEVADTLVVLRRRSEL